MKAIALLASLTLALATTSTKAAIVWSGIVDIPIPSGLDGVYLNLGSGSSQTAADDSFQFTDVNFALGGFAIRSSGDFRPARVGTGNTDAIVNLSLGTLVDSNLSFALAAVGISDTHVGSGAGQFESGEEGYLGFIFGDDGSGDFFGWARVTLTANGIGAIHEFAYENSASGVPITVGAIPEPSSLLLAALGCVGLLFRRR